MILYSFEDYAYDQYVLNPDESKFLIKKYSIGLFISLDSRMLDEFSYERKTQVYYSCSVVLSGKMWVFGGGYDFDRQLSSVGQCRLKTEGRLPFDLSYGAANTVDGFNGAETAFLCFNYMYQHIPSPYNACNSYVNISLYTIDFYILILRRFI